MSGRFEEALAQNPAPKRLGDVRLRYEPSLLIGEADRVERGLFFQVALLTALGAGLGFLALTIFGAPTVLIALAAMTAAASVGFAAVLDQRARRQRRFVLNFISTTLRLDFSTPFANRPRTQVVPFDQVRDCALYTQGNGRLALTVDFVADPGSRQLLREVLVANVPVGDEAHAQRLQRVLNGAFGLGHPDPDHPERSP